MLKSKKIQNKLRLTQIYVCISIVCSPRSIISTKLINCMYYLQTIRYLLSVDAIRAEAIGMNGMSLTMLDILEYSSIAREDFSRSLEIQQILIDAGLIRRENDENDKPNSDVDAAAVVSPNPRRVKKKEKLHKQGASSEKGSNPARRWWIKLMKWLRYPSDWLVETRGMLMVVATMISTMTFQAVVNPPGGVWQNDDTNSTGCTADNRCTAGTTVLGYVWKHDFVTFIKYNTTSFLASLCVTLLLISGFPLHNRLFMWLLSMSMCVTLTFLALTYLQVLFLIIPGNDIYDSYIIIYKNCFYPWIVLLVIVGVIHTIRFLIWVVKRLRPQYFRTKSGLRNMIATGSFSCNDPMRFQEIDLQPVV
ncbi:hypothetical protein C1H46_020646 [Malus baccata]|uniref:PGG domain-containing protein n=1 Tax=Malus baccata TaxID=106549 RepID=A0A540M4S3_MALBA|nr:hypothetical protein C1H46_020646 [Malus baccata]